jgi:hypothetical protein
MMARRSYVYFIRPIGQPGPIKIGCSADPARRLVGYGLWSPVPLEIAALIEVQETGPRRRDALRLERQIHARHVGARLHHEWFRPTPALLAEIAAVRLAAEPAAEAA